MTGIEIAAVAAAVGIAKNLKELTSSLGDSVPQEVRNQIVALFDRVMDVQTEVLTAQHREIKLTERCRELEDQLKRVEDWDAVKAGYIRQNVGRAGEIAYRPKSPESGADHLLCANCFEDGTKSYLQAHGVKWKCPRCPTSLSRLTRRSP